MLLLHANNHVRQRRKHPDVGFPVAFISIRHQDIFETAIWKFSSIVFPNKILHLANLY